MTTDRLDRIDMGILHMLQADARNITTEEIGDNVGLTSSSVAARIKALENDGVITGYAPMIDYDAAGFDNHVLVRASLPDDDRRPVMEASIDIPNVVSVREVVGGDLNLILEVVSREQERIEEVVSELNDLGVEVLGTEILKEEYERAFDTFGAKYTTDES